jgi:hypothetical protein
MDAVAVAAVDIFCPASLAKQYKVFAPGASHVYDIDGVAVHSQAADELVALRQYPVTPTASVAVWVTVVVNPDDHKRVHAV